ncbi:hypothetical protein EsH8_X_000449 [Colletotrichum jinshuiense]
MAPLGVITAIVSVIRVCGGPSLRAFIGRAQEGGGVSEAELCSSTSRDVCELYHNGAIVRVFGRPKILEVVHHREVATENVSQNYQRPPLEDGIYSFQEYIGKDLSKNAGWREIKKFTRDDEESRTSPKERNDSEDSFAPNPNLSFNIGIKRRPEWVLWLAAGFSFLAQVTVLLFGGLVTAWRWEKEGETPPTWAFPLMVIGTILLCGGMFLCAFLIENSTKERVFRRSPDNKTKGENSGYGNSGGGNNISSTSVIYVVQPGNQIIGDQTFDSFLYDNSINDSSQPEKYYTTSWKISQQSDKPLKVWTAIVVTMVGFILQFVGFRAMHSAVSVLQLGVILIVSIIRAALRSQRLKKNDNLVHNRPDEVEGFELDWLAWHMAKDKQDKRDEKDNQSEQDERDTESHISWFITGPKTKPDSTCISKDSNNTCDEDGIDKGLSNDITCLDPQNSSQKKNEGQGVIKVSQPKPDLLEKAFHYRSRLAELTSQSTLVNSKSSTAWKDDLVHVRQQARQLKKAIDSSARVLFTHATKNSNEDTEPLSWTIPIAEHSTKGAFQASPDIFVSIRTNSDQSTVCDVNQQDLEALLGLWTWSIISDPQTETTDEELKLKVSHASEVPISRIMAVGKDLEDLELAKIEMQFLTDEFLSLASRTWANEPDPMERGPHRLWRTENNNNGEPTGKLTAEPDLHSRQYKSLFRLFGWQFATPPILAASTTTLGHTISTACAHDIYQSFLYAAVQDLESIGGCTKFSRGGRGLFLENDAVSDLIKRFEESGLGSKQDAICVILPVLRHQSKLPSAVENLPEVYGEAEELGKRRSFKEAEDVLRWAWQSAGEIRNDKQKIAALEATMLEFGELYRNALLSNECQEEFARQGVSWMKNQLPQDAPDSLVDISNRYIKFRETSGNDSTDTSTNAIDVIAALSAENRTETLWLISQARELSSCDDRGRTVLSWAAARGWPEIVKAALKIGSTVEYADKSGRTPLSYAAEYGHADVVKILMKNKALPAAADRSKRTPLEYAAARGCVDVMRELLSDPRVDIRHWDNDGYSSLHWAAENGQDDAIKLLLKEGAIIDARDFKDCTPLIVALQKRQKGAADLLEVAIKAYDFDRYGRHGEITNKTVEAAAFGSYTFNVWLYEHGNETAEPKALSFHEDKEFKIVSQLLDQLGKQIKLTDIFRAAAGNKRSGEKLIRLLLEEWGKEVKVTEEVLKAAAANKQSGEKVIKLLLEERGEEVKVTEEILKAAAANKKSGEKVLRLLLEERGEEVKVTEEVIKAAAANEQSGEKVVRLLLQERGEEVKITEQILMAAAGNRYCCEKVVRLLLKERGEEVKVTERVLMAAAGKRNCGKDVVRLLLEERGEEVKVTEQVLMAAAGNRNCGEEVVRLLLEERGGEFEVTEEILKVAAATGEKVVKLLLEERGEEVKITEEILKAAVGDEYSGEEVVRLLLEERGEEVKITKDVFNEAVKCGGVRVVRLLFEERGEEVKVTEQVLTAAAGNRVYGEQMVRLLLEERGEEVKVTEQVLIAVAENRDCGEEVVRLLIEERGEEVKVTDKLVEVLVSEFGVEMRDLLLGQQGEMAKAQGEAVKDGSRDED